VEGRSLYDDKLPYNYIDQNLEQEIAPHIIVASMLMREHFE
jgi:hypothetical protein